LSRRDVMSTQAASDCVGFPAETPLHAITSSGYPHARSDVTTGKSASGASLHLFLVLHSSILKPDFHLSLGENQPLRQLPADRLGDVHI